MGRRERAGLMAAAAFVGFLIGAAVASLFVSDECTFSPDVTGECEVGAVGSEWRLLLGAIPAALLFGAIALLLLRRHAHRFEHRYTDQS